MISICLPETVFNRSRHIFRIYFTLFRTEINTKKWRLIYDTNFRYFFVVEILTAECCHDLIMRVPKRFAAESATLFALCDTKSDTAVNEQNVSDRIYVIFVCDGFFVQKIIIFSLMFLVIIMWIWWNILFFTAKKVMYSS